jgi:hypothetical protein
MVHIQIYMSHVIIACKDLHILEFLNTILIRMNHHQPINVPTTGAQAFLYGLHIRSTGHDPQRGPSAGSWVLTTANTAGTNGFACLSKHEVVRDNKFLVTLL